LNSDSAYSSLIGISKEAIKRKKTRLYLSTQAEHNKVYSRYLNSYRKASTPDAAADATRTARRFPPPLQERGDERVLLRRLDGNARQRHRDREREVLSLGS
jgi:hypothetical protein